MGTQGSESSALKAMLVNFACAFMLVAAVFLYALAKPRTVPAPESESMELLHEVAREAAAGNQVDVTASVRADVEALSAPSLGGRLSGTDGCERAAQYVERRFREIGLERIGSQEFTVVVPVTKKASFEVAGEAFEIRPCWPNWVRTPTTRGIIEAPVVCASTGKMGDYDGRDVAGSIVVLDGDTGYDWFGAGLLGAEAVIFVEPARPDRETCEKKFSSVPVDIPRFWMSRERGLELARRAAESKEPLRARLECRVDWEERKARNVWAWLPGSGQAAEAEKVVAVTSYYDSISVAQDAAPGADSACGVAAMLAVAQDLKGSPPPRSTLFVALAGHFEALEGTRAFADMIYVEHEKLLAQVRSAEEAILHTRGLAKVRWYADAPSLIGGIAAILAVAGLAAFAITRHKAWTGLAGAGLAVAVVSCGVLAMREVRLRQYGKEFDVERVENLRRVMLPLKEKDAALYESLRGELQSWEKTVSEARAARRLYDACTAERRTRLLKGKLSSFVEEARGAKGEALDRMEIERKKVEGEINALKARLDAEGATPRLDAAIKAAAAADAEGLDRLCSDSAAELLSEACAASGAFSRYARMRGLVEEAARANPALKPEIDRILREVDKCGEEDKVVATEAIRYRRLLRHLRGLEALGVETPGRLQFTWALDISSRTDTVGVFYKGHYVDLWESGYERVPLKAVSGVSTRAVALAEAQAKSALDGRDPSRGEALADGVVAKDRHWTNLVSFPIAIDGEMMMLSGRAALTLMSAYDARPFLDTPADTADRVDWKRLGEQLGTLVPLMSGALRDPGMLREYDDVTGRALLKTGRMSRLTGRTVSYDPRSGMGIANTPVPGGLMVQYRNPGDMARDRARAIFGGVRAPMMTFGDERGNWEFVGTSHQKARSWSDRNDRIEGYLFDPETGDITWSPDRGEQGEMKFSTDVPVNKETVELTVVLFECTAVSVFDLLDRRSWQMFTSVDVYDAATDSTPFAFGYRSTGKVGSNESYIEPAVTLFLQNPTRWKASFGHGIAGGKYTLLNVPGGGTEETSLGYFAGREMLSDFETSASVKDPWGGLAKGSGDSRIVAPSRDGDAATGSGGFCLAMSPDSSIRYAPAKPVDWRQFARLRIRAFTRKPAGVSIRLATRSSPDGRKLDIPLAGGAQIVSVRLADLAGAPRAASSLEGSPDEMGAVTSLEIAARSSGEQGGDALICLDDILVESSRLVTCTPYKMARDLHNLDAFRIANLRKHSVTNDKIEDLHNRAKGALDAATGAWTLREYEKFIKESRNAWGYEGRAYPSVQGTTVDILTGVLFYLFLLLPFSYFAERLLFAFPEVNRQLLGFFGIFLIVFAVLWKVHPAFGITNAAPIILLAFVTLALSILVMSMIRSRFELELNRLQQRPGTSKQQDMSRINASKTAFLLGISNMRRRKTRTLLTLSTLVLLMFSILSFTSIRPQLLIQSRPILDLSGAASVETKGLPIEDEFDGAALDALKWIGVTEGTSGASEPRISVAGGEATMELVPPAKAPRGALPTGAFSGISSARSISCSDWLSISTSIRLPAAAGETVMSVRDGAGNELGLAFEPAGDRAGYRLHSVEHGGAGFLGSRAFKAAAVFLLAAMALGLLLRITGARVLRTWALSAAALAGLAALAWFAPVGREEAEKILPPLGDEATAAHQWRLRLNTRTKEFLVYIDDYVVAQGSCPELLGELRWMIGRNLASGAGDGAPSTVVLASARASEEKRNIPWQGIMFRARDWSALSEAAYKSILTEFDPAEGNVVAPRAWKVASQRQNITTSIKVSNAASPEKSFYVAGLTGLSRFEPAVSRADLACGRWFAQGDVSSCVLSGRQAAVLGIDPLKVTGSPEGAPAVVVHGERLAVVGITEDRTFAGKTDIDTEELAPVDFTQESWQKHQGREAETTAFYRYTHISNVNVLWVPFEYLMERGGTLRSVAVKPVRPVKDLVTNDLLQRLEVPIFVAEKQRVTFQSSVSRSPISELRNLIVPVLIAALIVLNTMLGAVYEREREIWIYGSLGLAPVHIASLFMAESCVFATVATVFGYVAGQVSAKLITVTGLLPGLNLNYSSKSAVFSAAFLIAVVLLSTIYPARRAAQLSVPDVERIWKFPEAQGDRLIFEFPFTMSGDQALGLPQHLKKFFEDHSNQSVGEFYTADVVFRAQSPGGAPSAAPRGCRLEGSVWIAPFDFGISQKLTLDTVPTVDKDVYEARMVLERLSGENTAWVKMNHRFLKILRKQFLVWRLFTAEERAYYAGLARAELGLVAERRA